MATSKPPPIEALLELAAESIRPVVDVEPWKYGWCVEDYRRSEGAALPSPAGPVGMSPEGVAAYEGVVSRLLGEPGIKGLWDDQELWGVVASFVVALAEADDRPAFMASGLARLRDGGPSLVLVPLANVRWGGEPKVIGDGVIGRLDYMFGNLVAEV